MSDYASEIIRLDIPIDALRRIYVAEDQPAWSVNLRSKATLRKEAKRHFVDPSLAAAMLRATPERLLSDPTAFGALFESCSASRTRQPANARPAWPLC